MTSECPLCGSIGSEVWFERRRVPVHQNRVFASLEEARACPRAHLILAMCSSCSFVFNTAFDPATLSYDAGYENTQQVSGTFAAYTRSLARRLATDWGLAGKTALEVGCGKGDFLTQLLEAGLASGIGYDSCYDGPPSSHEGRIRFIARMFTPTGTHAASLVCARHVIEHVPRPIPFLQAMRGELQEPDALAFLETPRLEWILEKGAFWDLFYEHCSYFDDFTLALACETVGLNVAHAEATFGDQYGVVLARPYSPRQLDPARNVAHIRSLRTAFESRARALEARVRETLDQHANGRVAIWGAGAKGTTILNVVDPDGVRICYAVDINPAKQGRFIPGSGHRILGPDTLRHEPPSAIILMNENYRTEIERLLPKLGVVAPLLGLEPDVHGEEQRWS